MPIRRHCNLFGRLLFIFHKTYVRIDYVRNMKLRTEYKIVGEVTVITKVQLVIPTDCGSDEVRLTNISIMLLYMLEHSKWRIAKPIYAIAMYLYGIEYKDDEKNKRLRIYNK